LHGNLTFGFVIFPVCYLADLVAVVGKVAAAAYLEVRGTAVAVGTGARWHGDGRMKGLMVLCERVMRVNP
jgi:hypothetical protein